MTHLDTHVVVWLHGGHQDRFPARARRALEEGDLVISPMVVLELEYLFEIGRVRKGPNDVLAHLATALGLRLAEDPFPAVIAAASEQRWTRDPFDRVIVGQAALSSARLVTKDATIAAGYSHVVWD